MLDFGILPPEINSARMYSGPGSGPLLAAASAWAALAAQLELFAAGYSTVLSELLDTSWSGAAASAMAGAVAPYVAWALTTAAQAEHITNQARAAAAAYEAAYAATVPPEVVAANRILLATLVATNFFGQNTPMIAATEAAYVEMWAQDATAMYCYAASSLVATQPVPLSAPPQSTTGGGLADEVAAAAHLVATSSAEHAKLCQMVAQLLQTLATAGHSDSRWMFWPTLLVTLVGDFNALTGPANLAAALSRTVTSAGRFGTGLYRSDVQAEAKALPITRAPTVRAGQNGVVLAGVGRAATVGRLSVPQSWTTASSQPSVGDTLPQPRGTGLRAVPAGSQDSPRASSNRLPGMGPMSGNVARRVGTPVLRTGRRRFTMPRPLSGG
ncbi:PPE family protein [Mycobacterium persicum]|uniref:PPE family protein n=1 Tax=Mycobacterium persicum TaxID=1487726 RepID=UPI000C0803F4|nr:PPE family protein [Mycobacterium persicum]